MRELDNLTKGYLETALWADIPADDADRGFTIEDFTESSINEAYEICQKFRKDCEAAGLWEQAVNTTDETTVGHDLWLTKQGHGVGFWDGDYEPEENPELGNQLTEIVSAFPHQYLFVCQKDDYVKDSDIGKVLIERG